MINKQYRMLVITDHLTHKEGESIYPLLRTMAKNPACSSIEVASRGNLKNQGFFSRHDSTKVVSSLVDDNFTYQDNGEQFTNASLESDIKDFDVLFLRIDRPVTNSFLDFLITHVPQDKIINKPLGIKQTGSKEFLLNFRDICPPIRLCQNIDEILDLYHNFPIVLKPLESYGGKGILRIIDNIVWEKDKHYPLNEYKAIIQKNLETNGNYLAMKYLKNVSQGDKRLIVVNGKIMGATLRLPKEGSWICNLSMGGVSSFAEPDEQEIKIAETISPSIVEKGVVIFGFDTLVDDDGNRVLSEINTLNVGGLLQAEMHSGKPVIQESSNLIWSYICENIT